MSNYTKKDVDMIKGKEDEIRFAKHINSIGYTIIGREKKSDDYEKHIDFSILLDIAYIFDFKGESKEGHNKGLKGFTCIETQNVNGNIGWFLSKHINSLVFELPDTYILVNILTMRKFVEEKMKNEFFINTYKPNEHYKYYTRSRCGRNDIMFYMPFKDIEPFIIKTFHKNLDYYLNYHHDQDLYYIL